MQPFDALGLDEERRYSAVEWPAFHCVRSGSVRANPGISGGTETNLRLTMAQPRTSYEVPWVMESGLRFARCYDPKIPNRFIRRPPTAAGSHLNPPQNRANQRAPARA